MSEQWLNYTALGQQWRMSPEAAGTLARRGRYERSVGNDGQAEVLVDTAAAARKASPLRAAWQSQTAAPMPSPDAEPPPAATVAALQTDIDDLNAQIAKTDVQADQLRKERDGRKLELGAEWVATLTGEMLDAEAKAEAEAAARARGCWQRLVY